MKSHVYFIAIQVYNNKSYLTTILSSGACCFIFNNNFKINIFFGTFEITYVRHCEFHDLSTFLYHSHETIS